jgi:hypothetical protein
MKWYRSIDRCEDHIASGKHVYPTEKACLLDVAVRTFKTETDKFVSKSTITLPMNTTFTLPMSSSCLLEGWALPQPKVNKRFTSEQIAFMVEKYDEGEQSGNKWNPVAVASVRDRCPNAKASTVFQAMRTVKLAGRFRFPPEDHLTTSQVKSYFSKLTSNRRKQSQTIPDVASGERMDTGQLDASSQDDDDVEDEEENEDDFESLLHESERQELRLEIGQVLGSRSLRNQKNE